MKSAPSPNEPTPQPTLIGYIETTQDTCLLFEACLSGVLPHIPRFPRQRELQRLLYAGNIFVYAEPPNDPGSWDDGKSWTFVGWGDGLRIEREHSGPDTLMKNSGNIVLRGFRHNFVSYYTIKDTLNWTLERPSQNSELQGISLRQDLARLLRVASA